MLSSGESMATQTTSDVTERLQNIEPWRLWPAGYAQKCGHGQWVLARHHELISRKITEATFGPKRRLLITLPPRHGKSELTSHYGPVWFLDLFPELRGAIATYGDEFSEEWGQKVRDTINDNPGLLRVRLRKDTTAKRRWTTTHGGGLIAIGVGGRFVGRGADFLVIDDPHKDWAEAHSIVKRDAVWDWWPGTARHRLEPGAVVIVIMTRWHEDDFAGRLLTEQPELWEHVRLPAIAEGDDVLGRKEGEALWPEKYNIDELRQLEQELGPYLFGAIFQQNPSSPEGAILKRGWWRYYDYLPEPRTQAQWLTSWDMTFKDTDGTDYVVGQVWARYGGDKYLVDQVRDRMTFTKTCEQVQRLAKKWPQCTAHIIEEKANGSAVINMLSSIVPGMLPWNPTDSKEARAWAVSPHVQSGNCYLPNPNVETFRWVKDFIDECAQFPEGMNDDMVDTFTQAMIKGFDVGVPILGVEKQATGRRRGRR